MTFTYDVSTDIGKVRFELGDTVSGSGVRADGTNISDEEIQMLLTREGSEIMQAVAGACEMLARDWARVANLSVGPRSEQFGQISAQWAARSNEIRGTYGGYTAFSIGVDRTDGYSEHADEEPSA